MFVYRRFHEIWSSVALIAHYPEILSTVTNGLHRNEYRRERTNWYEIVLSAVSYKSLRQRVLTSCGMPSRITCHQRNYRLIFTLLKHQKVQRNIEKHHKGTKQTNEERIP